jgi:hypothetical protein
VILFEFSSLKNDVNIPSKSNRLKKLLNIIFLLASGRSMTKIAASGSKIRIRIHQSEAWIRGSGSGSTPICHGSGTLLPYIVGEAVFAAIPTVSTVLLTTVGNAGDV